MGRYLIYSLETVRHEIKTINSSPGSRLPVYILLPVILLTSLTTIKPQPKPGNYFY